MEQERLRYEQKLPEMIRQTARDLKQRCRPMRASGRHKRLIYLKEGNESPAASKMCTFFDGDFCDYQIIF